jgi:hypothetical protein
MDLSLPKIMTMPENELEALLNNPNALEKLAEDNRHVQVIQYRIVSMHYKSVREFNKSAAILSQKIFWLTWILVILTIVLTFLTAKMVLV